MILGIKFNTVSNFERVLRLRVATIVCEKCGKVCSSSVSYDDRTRELILNNRNYCCLCLAVDLVKCRFCKRRKMESDSGM